MQSSWALAFSVTAFILFVPAMTFPFLTMNFYGRKNSSTLWESVVQLYDSGSYFVAGIIFLASIVFPLLKILGLFYLSLSSSKDSSLAKTWLYRSIEYIGRWSMLDIFVLAILVTVMKVGAAGEVQPEIGSLLFALVVVFTMFASASFDPRSLWRKENV